MSRFRSATAGVLAGALAAGSLSLAVTALGKGGDHGNRGGEARHGGELRSALAPSLPGDPSLHGVAPGGAPWVLDRGSVRLQGKRLRVRVRGLVIPAPQGNNTAGGVTTITASVYCGDATTAAATTTPVALSQSGDARIDQRLTLSGVCLGPVVLVHPNGGLARYIAASGFGR